MEISEYRQQLTSELTAAREQVDAQCEVAFNSSNADADREAAMQKVAGCLNEENTTKMIDVVCDVGASITLRSAAIRTVSGETSHDDDFIKILLSLVGDSDEPTVLRTTALDVLQQSTFHSVTFQAMRAEYLATLRSLVDDNDKAMRHQAIQLLAYVNDEYVQRRLVESIKTRSHKMIGITQAIQLLSSDLHAENADVLTEIILDPPSTRVF